MTEPSVPGEEQKVGKGGLLLKAPVTVVALSWGCWGCAVLEDKTAQHRVCAVVGVSWEVSCWYRYVPLVKMNSVVHVFPSPHLSSTPLLPLSQTIASDT